MEIDGLCQAWHLIAIKGLSDGPLVPLMPRLRSWDETDFPLPPSTLFILELVPPEVGRTIERVENQMEVWLNERKVCKKSREL